MDGYVVRARSVLGRAFGPLVSATTWRALLYHALDLPVAWLRPPWWSEPASPASSSSRSPR